MINIIYYNAIKRNCQSQNEKWNMVKIHEKAMANCRKNVP